VWDSSDGLAVSPPNSITLASGLSVAHMRPGATGISAKFSMPLPRYILKLCMVMRWARSLRRVFSSSCSGISGSTSLEPAYSNGTARFWMCTSGSSARLLTPEAMSFPSS
jgi:hypothetical protein